VQDRVHPLTDLYGADRLPSACQKSNQRLENQHIADHFLPDQLPTARLSGTWQYGKKIPLAGRRLAEPIGPSLGTKLADRSKKLDLVELRRP
jgi:hypothetical protein